MTTTTTTGDSTINYSANDICKIIKASSEANVSSIKLGVMEINFLTEKPLSTNNIPRSPVISNSDNILTPQQVAEIKELEQAEFKDFYGSDNPHEHEQSLILHQKQRIDD